MSEDEILGELFEAMHPDEAGAVYESYNGDGDPELQDSLAPPEDYEGAHDELPVAGRGEVPEMAPRTRRGVPGRSSATRERRRGFFGRATRRSSRACLGRVHADPRVSGEETLRVRCSPVRSRKSLRFGNHRAGRVRARASSASVVRASAGTHLAAEAMVMEEAILLTGESSECCDGR